MILYSAFLLRLSKILLKGGYYGEKRKRKRTTAENFCKSRPRFLMRFTSRLLVRFTSRILVRFTSRWKMLDSMIFSIICHRYLSDSANSSKVLWGVSASLRFATSSRAASVSSFGSLISNGTGYEKRGIFNFCLRVFSSLCKNFDVIPAHIMSLLKQFQYGCRQGEPPAY